MARVWDHLHMTCGTHNNHCPLCVPCNLSYPVPSREEQLIRDNQSLRDRVIALENELESWRNHVCPQWQPAPDWPWNPDTSSTGFPIKYNIW